MNENEIRPEVTESHTTDDEYCSDCGTYGDHGKYDCEKKQIATAENNLKLLKDLLLDLGYTYMDESGDYYKGKHLIQISSTIAK